MLMVELTLNYNHVTDVISISSSNIATPSQLLPLLVGILGLVRVLYIMYRETQLEYEIKKAKAEAIAAGKGDDELEEVEKQILLMRTKSDYVIEEDDELLKIGMTKRYVVALLPWLSMTGLWKKGSQRSMSGVAGSRGLGGPGVGDDEEEMVSLDSASASLRKGVVLTSAEPMSGAISP